MHIPDQKIPLAKEFSCRMRGLSVTGEGKENLIRDGIITGLSARKHSL